MGTGDAGACGSTLGARMRSWYSARMAAPILVEVPKDFGLKATARSHGWYEIPPFQYAPETGILSVALRSAKGTPTRLDLTQSSVGSPVQITISGRGSAGEARAIARRVLNLDWDLVPFHAVCCRYAPLGWVRRAGAGRILRGPSVFSDVVSSICGTNIAWKQAVKAIHRLASIAPMAPGGLRTFPTAEELLLAGEAHLRDTARLGYRAGYVLSYCQRVVEGAVDLSTP
jgi:3-methyladenine DNA glycosylase/8-oxoguanine DNA glycosylase